MQKLTYKEREKQRREEEILTFAQQLVTERGYANLNMDDLAEHVGISKPTLYQHFKSKEELVARVFLRSFEAAEQFLLEPLNEPAIERVKGLMRWLIAKRYESGGMMAGLRPDAVWNVLRANPDVEARKGRFYAHLAELVEAAKQEGDIDSSLPTRIVVQSLLCLQGAVNDPALQASADGLQVTIDSLIRIFLNGVTPDSSARHSESNRN